ncbi:hypothetical protein O9K51_06891 [Purpureocillium lavendulum]|uniref:Uncharacterized protein n=1 Tax=Purpureocillium lavendulum TaxID=1247861 RepID=A0AB34FPM3_9HYPO|nr:hypothetical protein O9K51_06891 [Purpureocillium lavendulum]
MPPRLGILLPLQQEASSIALLGLAPALGPLKVPRVDIAPDVLGGQGAVGEVRAQVADGAARRLGEGAVAVGLDLDEARALEGGARDPGRLERADGVVGRRQHQQRVGGARAVARAEGVRARQRPLLAHVVDAVVRQRKGVRPVEGEEDGVEGLAAVRQVRGADGAVVELDDVAGLADGPEGGRLAAAVGEEGAGRVAFAAGRHQGGQPLPGVYMCRHTPDSHMALWSSTPYVVASTYTGSGSLLRPSRKRMTLAWSCRAGGALESEPEPEPAPPPGGACDDDDDDDDDDGTRRARAHLSGPALTHSSKKPSSTRCESRRAVPVKDVGDAVDDDARGPLGEHLRVRLAQDAPVAQPPVDHVALADGVEDAVHVGSRLRRVDVAAVLAERVGAGAHVVGRPGVAVRALALALGLAVVGVAHGLARRLVRVAAGERPRRVDAARVEAQDVVALLDELAQLRPVAVHEREARAARSAGVHDEVARRVVAPAQPHERHVERLAAAVVAGVELVHGHVDGAALEPPAPDLAARRPLDVLARVRQQSVATAVAVVPPRVASRDDVGDELEREPAEGEGRGAGLGELGLGPGPPLGSGGGGGGGGRALLVHVGARARVGLVVRNAALETQRSVVPGSQQ